MNYTMDGFRKDVKVAMVTSTQKPLYRVRKTWNDTSSQIGAYSMLDNAKKACDKAGDAYKVFDASGKVVYPTTFPVYKVKVMTDILNIRDSASTEYRINGCIRDCGIYTIVEEKNGFGKLLSGAGWICLNYTTKV